MQKLVLLVLANRHNSETGRCDPSLVRLAKDCGLDKTTVQRSLTALSERSLVERTRRKSEGVFASTAYVLQMGVGAERTNVGAENTNPIDAENTNGRCAAHQGVGAERTINQEVKPGREPEAEAPAEKRSKLAVMKRIPRGQNAHLSDVPLGMPIEPWTDYVSMRKERGKPLTATAAKLLAGKITKLKAEGHDPALLLNKASEHQWLTVYPGDDTKGAPRKVEYVELSPEEAAEQWERDFGKATRV